MENNKIKKSKNSKLIYTFIIIVVATIIFVICSIFLNSKMLVNSSKSLLNKKLIELTDEINNSCPYMIDEITRLDNCYIKDQKTIIYNYTIIGYNEKEMKNIFTNENIDKQKELLVNMVKTSLNFNFFKDNQINLEYIFKSELNDFIIAIKLPYELFI